MKNIFVKIAIFISFFLFSHATHAEIEEDPNCLSIEQFDDEDDYYTHPKNKPEGVVLSGGYVNYEGIIYHWYCPVKGTNVSTFRTIEVDGITHGKDDTYLYWKGTPLYGLDPNNFSSKKIWTQKDGDDLWRIFVYDADTMYVDGMDVSGFGIDIETVEMINYEWLKDKNSVYEIKKNDNPTRLEDLYYTEKLIGAQSQYFTFGYNITDNTVYWYGKRIPEADKESFEALYMCGSAIAKDKNNAYWKGNVISGADAKSFTKAVVNEGGYCVDKNGFYGSDDGKRYLTIEYMKNKYPSDSDQIDQAIADAIKEYETKYPGYESQPAKPGIFTDVSTGNPIYQITTSAHTAGYLTGYPDGSMKPENPINRAEFAKLLILAFKQPEGDPNLLKKYSDADTAGWYAPTLAKMVELKVMQGYSDGTMKPEQTITESEGVKMLLTLTKAEITSNATDPWYQKYYDNKPSELSFLTQENADKKMTRGLAVQMIEAVRQKMLPSETPSPSPILEISPTPTPTPTTGATEEKISFWQFWKWW